jgi:hypothetical protein
LPSDSTFTVEIPSYPRAQLLYYRNIVGVVFNRSASGVTIRNLLARYQASVIGGVAGAAGSEYIVRVPDPGPTLQALESLLARLEREPAVRYASSVSYRTPSSIYAAHQGDTTRPAMPKRLNLPQDSTFTVHRPDDSLSLYYRNIVGIVFDDTTSGSTIRALLRRYNGTIIGGSPYTESFGAYVVEVPDPGPDFDKLDALLNRITREPGVSYAYGLTYRSAIDLR